MNGKVLVTIVDLSLSATFVDNFGPALRQRNIGTDDEVDVDVGIGDDEMLSTSRPAYTVKRVIINYRSPPDKRSSRQMLFTVGSLS